VTHILVTTRFARFGERRSTKPMQPMNGAVVQRLYDLIVSRRGADPERSYVARLFQKGRPKMAQKVGEEAVEVAIAAMQHDHDHMVSESADLLFHLLVLWADAGIRPAEVWAELERREGTSGVDEKKQRVA
jgi:phosphoribosyl-ATP pyrophosphohydrolase